MAIPPLGVLKISCRARIAAVFSVFRCWNRPVQHAILAVSEDRGNRAYFSIDFRGGNLRFTPTPGARLVTRAPHALKKQNKGRPVSWGSLHGIELEAQCSGATF